MHFHDRADAGRQLGRRLAGLGLASPVVLGLPRGGVAVAEEVARALGAPLDIWVSRKLGAPMQPELGVGAVAEGGIVDLDHELVATLGLTQDEIDWRVRREAEEVARRVQHLRGGRPPPQLSGKTAIVIDDGVATGGTARAALRGVRARGPGRLLLAVPIAARQALSSLAPEADEIVCLEAPDDLWAVGAWYDEFDPVSDARVAQILERAAGREAVGRQVIVAADGVTLEGRLDVPSGARGVVIFAHGSGSSRFSPRNRLVAAALAEGGLGTLLFDLLSADEERRDALTGELRFDIGFLARRLSAVEAWLERDESVGGLPFAYFGSSTGAAAALVAAADRPGRIGAVVSRGGRVDLAERALPGVGVPALFIVGSLDEELLARNREAAGLMRAPVELRVVRGASHLFEEPGALEEVAKIAAEWLARRLIALRPEPPGVHA